jgi:nicotinate-nucleotide adenylyltransferase
MVMLRSTSPFGSRADTSTRLTSAVGGGCDFSRPSLRRDLGFILGVVVHREPMALALLGGTFDPPHIGHLVVAETAYRSLGVESVVLLPAGDPWQKADREVTSAELRLEMAGLAVSSTDYFEVDDREVRRDGPTYTFDTVGSFAEDEELWLVLGADAAAGFRSWHRWEELLERVRIAVVPRPGTERGQVHEEIGEWAKWLRMPELPVSGTAIREHAREGGSIRFLVPDPVWAFVEELGLYVGEAGDLR